MSQPENAGAETDARPGLSERANEIALALAEAAQVAKDAGERQTISLATSRAESMAARIEAAVAVRDALLQKSVTVSDLGDGPRQKTRSARATLKRAIPAFSDPDVTLSNRLNGKAVQGGFSDVEAIAKAMEKLLNEAVNAYRLERLPNDLGQPIPDLPNKDLVAVKLRGIQLRLGSEVAGRPVGELASRVDQVDADVLAWSELRPALGAAFAQLPRAIQEFMSAAISEHGAPWELVTHEVRTWLDQDGNADSCIVRLQRD